MERVIAVEDNLGTFKDYLAAKGCRIIDVEEAEDQEVDAVVISGSDENLMGIQEIIIDAPIISADGLTPKEVWALIQER